MCPFYMFQTQHMNSAQDYHSGGMYSVQRALVSQLKRGSSVLLVSQLFEKKEEHFTEKGQTKYNRVLYEKKMPNLLKAKEIQRRQHRQMQTPKV